MERIKRYVMSRDGIGFFKAILESYEEVALLTVLDGQRGEVEIIYHPAMEEVVKGIITDMSRYGIVFREVPSGQ